MSKVNDLKEQVSKLTPKDFASDQDIDGVLVVVIILF